MIISNIRIKNEIKNIEIEDGRILRIFDDNCIGGFDGKGLKVIPGLIDVHLHGCVGIDTMDADFEKMCAFLADNGTTSWLPTTMTEPFEKLKTVTSAKTDFDGANILGFHLEGPYINEEYKGAQNKNYIKKPNIDEVNKLDNVKMITLAPELDGGIDFIRKSPHIISLGHTACDYQTAKEAFLSGAKCVTHLFNAMPQLHHRKPSLIGYALENAEYCQIICDGFHIDKAVIKLAYSCLGSDKMILISDSLRATGMEDGEYELGGQDIEIINGHAYTKEGAIAGGTSTLMQCVKKAIEFGIPFNEAVKMATETPAKLLGIKKGKIETGYDADLLIVDDELNIKNVFIGGRLYR